MRVLALAGLLVIGCAMSVGPDGRWAEWSLADGFCISGAVAGISASLGHCGEDAELEEVPPRE